MNRIVKRSRGQPLVILKK